MNEQSAAIATLAGDDVVDRIAREIGKGVAAHIETMYPGATAGVAWKSCARSIEGHVRNSIAAAGAAAESGDIEAWLVEERRHRLEMAKVYRDLRKAEPGRTEEKAALTDQQNT